MSTTVNPPALVYNRIAKNRRKTLLLVAITIASVVPFVAFVSYGFSAWLVSQFSPPSHMSHVQETQLRRSAASYPDAFQQELERQLAAARQEREKQVLANQDRRLEIMALVAAALVVILGLLFWAIASSPTSHVLALCAARPAGAAEVETKRLLENLAIGAGLPPPKLYVIDSTMPNAFAAGVDPAHSVVAVTQGLLTLLDRQELEGVLAHELSHIGNQDTRLNTIVAAIALFLRMPFLLRKRKIQERRNAVYQSTPLFRRYRMFSLALLPIMLYMFVLAPLLAALIRAAISRGREFLADADAALLTRYPEGLLRALAKIHGAGSAVPGSNPVVAHFYFADPSAERTGISLMSLLGGNLLATHPSVEQRIGRLVEFNGGMPASVIENAVRAGREYRRDHPPLATVGLPAAVTQDELSVLTVGNPMGKVFRVVGATEPVPIYDKDTAGSNIVARVPPESLLVVFDDPGAFRQVLTHNEIFGYLSRTVKLQPVDMLPSEIHDPAARAAALSAPPPAPPVAVAAAAASSRLTPRQIALVALFSIAAFGVFFLALLTLSGK